MLQLEFELKLENLTILHQFSCHWLRISDDLQNCWLATPIKCSTAWENRAPVCRWLASGTFPITSEGLTLLRTLNPKFWMALLLTCLCSPFSFQISKVEISLVAPGSCLTSSFILVMCLQSVYTFSILFVHTVILQQWSNLCTWHLLYVCLSWERDGSSLLLFGGSFSLSFPYFPSPNRGCHMYWYCKVILGYINKSDLTWFN